MQANYSDPLGLKDPVGFKNSATSSSVKFSTRVLLIVSAVLLSSTLVLVFYAMNQGRAAIIENAVDEAKSTIEKYGVLRQYYTKNVVRKILKHSDLNVSFDHRLKDKTVPLPATMIHDLSEIFGEQERGMQLRLYSEFPFPGRKSRTLDEFGREAIAALNDAQQEFVRTETIGQSEYVRVALADRLNSETCVSCHNSHPLTPKNDWKLNDMRGVLEVLVPLDRALARNTSSVVRISVLSVVVFLFSMLCLWQLISRAVASKISSEAQALQQVAGELHGRTTEQIYELEAQSLITADINSNTNALTTMTREIRSNVRQVAELASSAAALCTEGQTSVAQAQQVVDEIGNNVDDVTKFISLVDEKTRQINIVLEIIGELATQTTILSYNAAIEAAAAGDAGKSFAVVARQVGQLAEHAKSASVDIHTLIKEVDASMVSTVKAMAGTTAAAQQGSNSQAKVSDVVKRVTAGIENTLEHAQRIERSTTEQSKTIEQVVSRIESILSSADKLKLSSSEINDSAEKLSGLARNLEH